MPHRMSYGLLGALILIVCCHIPARAAPEAELWSYWQKHNQASTRRIDHTRWEHLLSRYLATDHPSGIHRLRYAAVDGQDRDLLESYLDDLAATKVTRLNRKEQLAFWINLYNALTVQLVLDHYPVDTIRAIDISPGLFRRGPWDAKLLQIEGHYLSLNDIEHRILRPIWRDKRLHYALNCASLGCPNLQPLPFTASNSTQLLDRGARHFINHPRAVTINGDSLLLSSIYDWFRSDFGSSRQQLIDHLLDYADEDLARRLRNHRGGLSYRYDWRLNAP